MLKSHHILPLILFITPALADIEPGHVVSNIYWSDADSGKIDGERFRLYNVDAPETGGVGARGGAKCEGERSLGFEAKAFMVDLTKEAEVIVTATHGHDRMQEPRLLVELSVNGADLLQAGIDKGHLAPWPHEGSKKLAPKPDWCG